MSLKRFILPTVALGGATLLLIPAKTDAYTLLGGSLDTTRRDFRVFDNFTDPEANDNVTPDPNFPGYTGVELAIWKACTEWGSQLHGGTGDGDPHQPGDLGSGGANFDAVFQGNATSIGSMSSNTFSESSGGGPGILANIETAMSGGWRIRFNAFYTWSDGPGTSIPGVGVYDIQSIATEAYGRALGLGVSTVAGATMHAINNDNDVHKRSIAPDDIAGLQAIYGPADAFKPRITGINFSNGFLTIQGTNFDLVSNEVWFTPSTPGGTDVPVKVLGLSSNGTQIACGVPGTAGSGDVFIKQTVSTSGATLSNGWPIDSANFAPPPGIAYCFGDGSLPTPCPCVLPNNVPVPSGGPNSGCANSFDLDGATLTAAGSTSPDFVAFSAHIGGNSAAFALLLKGDASDPNGVANGDGVRCVDGQLIRFGSHYAGTNGAPLGWWTYPNSAQTISVSAATLQAPGQSAYYQLFYRNNAPAFCTPATTNMSNGYGINWP